MTLAADLNQPSTEAALSVLAASGWSMPAVSREWGIPYDRVRYLAHRHGISFKGHVRKYSKDAAIEMRERGMTYGQIARRIGCSDARAWRIVNGESTHEMRGLCRVTISQLSD